MHVYSYVYACMLMMTVYMFVLYCKYARPCGCDRQTHMIWSHKLTSFAVGVRMLYRVLVSSLPTAPL